MTPRHLTVTIDQGIATLTLDRPRSRNALSSSLLEDLPRVLAELDALAEVAVIVLTGSDPAFCAGLDLGELASSGANLRPAEGRPWADLEKPLIGAVNGAAITGGLELALHCDYLVASDRAVFADTHTLVGLVPFWGLTRLLPEAVGLRAAREMSLTNRFVPAHEALQMGLVQRVVPHDDLLPTVMHEAARLAASDHGAVREILSLYSEVGVPRSELQREARVAASFVGDEFDASRLQARVDALLSRNPTVTSMSPDPAGR